MPFGRLAAVPEAETVGSHSFRETLPGPAIALLTVGLLAADQGGYFPTAWGWAALGALLPLGIWLVAGGRTDAGPLDVALIGGVALLAAWTAASMLWSESQSDSLLEAERSVVYVSAVAAVLVLSRRSASNLLVGGIFAAILLVSLYSLFTRLFPDRFGSYDSIAGYRLSEPIGYWNGLGIFLTIGALLAIGIAARGRSVGWRVVAAASLTVIMPTLYFTFSRGAWIALCLGLFCALLFDARRVQLASWFLLLAPLPVLAATLARHSDALTHTDVPLADAVHDGHRLAWHLLFLAPTAALCAWAGIAVERRIQLPRALRLGYIGVLLAIPVVAIGLVLAHYGGPTGAVSRAYDSFKSPIPGFGSNLNKRLLTLSSHGRINLWRVAWHDYQDHSALGSGAGTFARHWFRDRPISANAQDAHSVFLETLAELGPIGLAALVAALAIPFVAAVRARRERFTALLLGAYVAFLFHAAVDWDFELPSVTLAGLFCGLAVVVAARRRRMTWSPGGKVRAAPIAAVVALTAFALVGLIGNSALGASERARKDQNWAKVESQARKARRLMPWSPRPWVTLGFAQSARGDLRGARSSFRRAIAKDAGDWTLWFDLAVVTKGKERNQALRHARALNPLSPEIAAFRSRFG